MSLRFTIAYVDSILRGTSTSLATWLWSRALSLTDGNVTHLHGNYDAVWILSISSRLTAANNFVTVKVILVKVENRMLFFKNFVTE